MFDLKLAAIAALAGLVIGAIGGVAVKTWQSKSELAHVKQQHAQVLSSLARASENVQKAVAASNRANQIKDSINEANQLAALDAEQAQTQRWRDAARRNPAAVGVRIPGAVCASNHSSDDSTPGSSVGDEGIEIVGSVRESVFDLRDAILEDRAKLRYFQQREREIQATGIEAGRINGN